jgi:hypothetical protein
MFFDDPIYGGAMRAANLIETFRGMGRNQEMFERNKMRQQALDSAAETEQTLKLMQLARPVDAAGRVQYGLNTPARVGKVPGFMPQISVNREVDPSRRLDVTGFDGRSRGVFEAMTADELMGRASQQQQAGLMQKLAADAQLEQIRQGTRLQREKGKAAFEADLKSEALQSSGGFLPENIATHFGIAKGTRLSGEDIKRYTDAFQGLQPKQATPQLATDDQGMMRAIAFGPDGNPVVKPVGKFGKSKAQPASAGGGAVDPMDDLLADTIMDDPNAYYDLTPSARTQIMPLLRQRGFTGFGKAMGEGAVDRTADGLSALESVRELATVLETEADRLGPIQGRLAISNPYNDLQGLQAQINLVRQRVGKALEGGVLRKEDEIKYEKILPTMSDTPRTARDKARIVVKELEKDMRVYEETQRRSGRNTGTVRPQGGAATQRPPLSSFEGK